MNIIVKDHREALAALCVKHHVTRLELFGSAAGVDERPQPNDLDFLVEFVPATPEEHADRYFGLKEDLEALFGVQVDLVEAKAMKNPYFIRRVNESRKLIYAA
ncbi:MAG: nucleotidyltransferase domain-containing protein [Nitrospinota bacterium]|nr:nucleotidyltransferase domain-containing protein [Nitrospinota bacterium]